MTVGQLIQRLKRFDPDMNVVVKPKQGHNMVDDFVDIKVTDIVELKTKALYKTPFWGEQIYDASEAVHDRNDKVLSLSGGTVFQRAPKGEE